MVLPLRALLAGCRRLPRPAARGDRRLCPLSLPPRWAPLSAPLPAAPAARLCSGEAKAAGGDGDGDRAMLRHLARKLRASGPVTVAEYMREALTNPGQVRGRAGPGGLSLGLRSPPLPRARCRFSLAGLLHASRRRRRERGLHHFARNKSSVRRGNALP